VTLHQLHSVQINMLKSILIPLLYGKIELQNKIYFTFHKMNYTSTNSVIMMDLCLSFSYV
jgi:hypothetical protein